MKSIAERLKIANRRGQGALWVLLCTVMFVATALGSPITSWRAEPDRFGDAAWEALGVEDRIQLARKRVGAGGIFAVRGETVIDAPIEKVASVIYDESRWTSGQIERAKLGCSGISEWLENVYQAVTCPS